jgi:hypothetical protein
VGLKWQGGQPWESSKSHLTDHPSESVGIKSRGNESPAEAGQGRRMNPSVVDRGLHRPAFLIRAAVEMFGLERGFHQSIIRFRSLSVPKIIIGRGDVPQ